MRIGWIQEDPLPVWAATVLCIPIPIARLSINDPPVLPGFGNPRGLSVEKFPAMSGEQSMVGCPVPACDLQGNRSHSSIQWKYGAF